MPGAGLTLYSLATPALPFGRDNLAAISDDDYVAPPATCSAGECARGLLQGLLRVGLGERLTAAQGLDMIEGARAEAEAAQMQAAAAESEAMMAEAMSQAQQAALQMRAEVSERVS